MTERRALAYGKPERELEKVRDWLQSPMASGLKRGLAQWAIGNHTDALLHHGLNELGFYRAGTTQIRKGKDCLFVYQLSRQRAFFTIGHDSGYLHLAARIKTKFSLHLPVQFARLVIVSRWQSHL